MATPRTLVLSCLLVLAGCGGSSHSSPSARSTSSSSSTSAAASAANKPADASCKPVSAPASKGAQHLRAPKQRLASARTYTATLQTNCGVIRIALDVRAAPKTAASFAYLAGRHFYDRLTFHRVVPGFVIQAGDPLGDGQGGPGYTVVERPPPATRYTQGTVAMAKTQRDPAGASGSQFFIVIGADAALPAQYALLGKLTAGADTVARIAALPADPRTGQPSTPVVISRLSVASGH